jgi:hypothetical protein
MLHVPMRRGQWAMTRFATEFRPRQTVSNTLRHGNSTHYV